MLFLEEGDTRPLSDDTGDMLDALCVDGRFDEDALAVPARRFKTAERQAEKKAYSPVIRIFSPSLGWETNMVFQPSHLSRDSSLPRREDVVFLSWNALFSCLSASERERLSGHNDVDVQWFDGEMRSRVLPLWIVPDPRPERESDYIWDENELMSLLGVSREYIEESRRNGYLDVIVPTLIKEGKLHAEKKDTSP